MKIKIGNFDFTECWDGVLYKKLSCFPDITDWEIQNVLDFINYETKNGRSCEIEAEDKILAAINSYKETYRAEIRVSPPQKITECTACPKYKGCMTDFVCHTAPLENAIKILECGRLLSPVLARKMTAKELKNEKRNAANDPEDYFDYICFAWGNCQAGDRLVMERKLGRFPSEEDLKFPNFTPGIRFFFLYDKLKKHPGITYEGVLPFKIKNEVVLSDWVYSIIIPEEYRERVKSHVSKELDKSIFYVKNDCKDIWKWSEKVYKVIKRL